MSTKINQKDLDKVSINWLYGSQLSWNYERMMGGGYLYSMLPIIEKLYGDDEETKIAMMNMQSQFFNTTPHMGGFILGIDIATEEAEGKQSKDTVSSLKTGLMGSYDFWSIVPNCFWFSGFLFSSTRKRDRSCCLGISKSGDFSLSIFLCKNRLYSRREISD